jgi:DNA polymerase-3 subunit delta'
MESISTEIFGQKKALNILHKFSQSGKIPHALLFNGRDGIGKYFAAREFVKFINTSENEERKIVVDKKISNLSEPYLKYIMPLPRGKNETGDDSPTSKLTNDTLEEIRSEIKKKIENPYHKISIDKANIIKISSIREINKFISFNYDDIKYRVIIIDHAHLMNPESQNALLKNLEEPPPGVLFILLTSAINRLLPTIISRCWQVNFEPLQTDEIKAVLIEHFKIDENISKKAAIFSNGSINTALQLIENDIEQLIDKTIFIIRYAAAKRYSAAYQELLKLLKISPTTRLPLIISMFIKWFDDAVKNKYNYNDYYFENHLETIITFNSKFKHVNIKSLIQKLDELQSMQERNVGLNLIAVNIILELASIRLR